MERRIFSSTLGIIVVINVMTFLFLDRIGVQIILALISISLITPAWLSYKNNKMLANKNKELLAQKETLTGKLLQTEENMNKIVSREKELRNLIESMRAFAFSLDTNGNLLYVSNEVSSFFGLEHQSIFTDINLIEDHIHPEDKAKFIKQKHKWILGDPSSTQYRIIVNNNEITWIELQMTYSYHSNGKVEKIYGLIIDITAQKEKEERLSQMAFHDTLTGLPNRIMLQTHLRKALSRARRKDHEVAIMFIDLDGFKDVNDKLGHEVGDALLQEVANRLNDSVREEDLISRLGGDEFIVVVEETERDEITTIAERILQQISSPFSILNDEVAISPSIGVTIYPEDGDKMDSLIRNADKAMYFAKNNGKGNYQFYTAELEDFQPKESVIDKLLGFFQK